MFFRRLFRRFFPVNRFTRDYIDVSSYKEDLDSINKEIRLVEDTIKYYELHYDMLKKYRDVLEVKLGHFDESDICRNCVFFDKSYCSKFDMSVNSDATCDDFKWGEE